MAVPTKPKPKHRYRIHGVAALSYPIHIHAPQGLPDGYTAVGKCPWAYDEVIIADAMLSEEQALSQIQPPPGGFLIGDYKALEVEYLGKVAHEQPERTYEPKEA